MLLFSAGLMAQDELKNFGRDSFAVIKIDLKSALDMMPKEALDKMMQESIQKMGFDFTERVDYIVVGLGSSVLAGDESSVVAVFSGNLSIDDLLNAASKEGKSIQKKNVAGLTAYYDPEDKGTHKVLVSNFAPNLFVFAGEEGLKEFQSVRAGQTPNALANSQLVSAYNDTRPNALFRMAGVFPEEMKSQMAGQMPQMADIQNMAMSVTDVGNQIDLNLAFGSENEASLNQIMATISQMMPMFTSMDQSGLLQEISDNMTMNVEGGKLKMATSLAKASLEKFFEQFKDQFGGMDYEDK